MTQCDCTGIDKLGGNFCYWCQLAVVEDLQPSLKSLEKEMETIAHNRAHQISHDNETSGELDVTEALNKMHHYDR